MEPRLLTRRTFLRWAAFATGASALAACGATATPQAQPTPVVAQQPTATTAVAVSTPAASTEVVEVRFAFWDWYAMAPGVRWDEWNQTQAFPVFQEANPGIKLSWELVDDFPKVLTQMSAGTAPDVMSVWDPNMTIWAEKGQLLDLQPFVDRDIPNADDIYTTLAWDQMWNPDLNMRMGMLADLDITSVYFNKTAFDEAGVPQPTTDWTTDDYKAAAIKLTKKDDSGNITRWGGELRGDFWTGWSYYILAYGGQVRDPETRMT
ncbi:MAG: ABC transporter substrate-binding protein, partial [Anaerolineae bacterium]